MKDPWIHHLVEHLPVLICALDEHGVFLGANAAFRELLGRDPNTVTGTHFSTLVHPDDLERVEKTFAATFASGGTQRAVEVRMLHADGSARWFSWSNPPTKDGVFVAIGTDVTERRRELLELETVRQQLKSVLETVPAYITMTKPDGEIEYINRTYPGVTPEQVVGTNLLNWLPPDHRESMQRAIDRVVAGEEQVEVTVQGSGADGGPTWYRSRLGALWRDNELVSILVVGEDITESTLAEQRRTQSARLETAGRIAAAVAHDFNNDLMAMLLSVEILQQNDTGDTTVQNELSELHATILRARQTTRQLSQAVRQPARVHEIVDLNQTLSDLIPLFQRSAGQAHQLEVHTPEDRLHVRLTRDEVARMLTHLVDNSRQAMRSPGRIEISVHVRTLESEGAQWVRPGHYVELVVSDTGPGIPGQLRDKVFDPFFSTKPKGKGFGLATCCAIARARGGDISVSCPKDGGTRVSLWLPLIDALETVPRKEPVDPTATISDARWTLLVAEDHDYTRTRIVRYLSNLGHRVLGARDGVDALEMLERHPGPVDALVSDLSMPRLDGVSLLERVKAERPEVALIAMSGSLGTAEAERLARLGIRSLEKPVTPADLLEALQHAKERVKT